MRLTEILFPSLRWKRRYRHERRARQRMEEALLMTRTREEAWLSVIEKYRLQPAAGEALEEVIGEMGVEMHELRQAHQRERERS